jgi:hypothetical protein
MLLGLYVGKVAPAEKDALVVGMELANPPFEMTDTFGISNRYLVDVLTL